MVLCLDSKFSVSSNICVIYYVFNDDVDYEKMLFSDV